MSSFTDPLIVSPLPDGRKWKLVDGFTYHVGSEQSPDIIHVPAGFITDFFDSLHDYVENFFIAAETRADDHW